MSFPKILAAVIFFVGCGIAFFSWSKHQTNKEQTQKIEKKEELVEVQMDKSVEEVVVFYPEKIEPEKAAHKLKQNSDNQGLPIVDRMEYLFKCYPPTLSIVETIVYSSKVDWLKGRQAYLGDYASHFQTSKHFISRSLKGKADYFSQNVSNGQRFNVLCKDKNIQFHLLLDLSRLKMWLYYFDVDKAERVLLKTYPVSAGKLDDHKNSGSLTPIGQYKLGKEVAIYKEGMTGTYNNEPCEMISVFGKRWIPFEKEIGFCTAAAKGLGIHGVPWEKDERQGNFAECRDCIEKYESSGCVRLLTEDIEEIFSIIITKPSFIHIVKDFKEAQLPGREIDPGV